jgi:hypothetical protein
MESLEMDFGVLNEDRREFTADEGIPLIADPIL